MEFHGGKAAGAPRLGLKQQSTVEKDLGIDLFLSWRVSASDRPELRKVATQDELNAPKRLLVATQLRQDRLHAVKELSTHHRSLTTCVFVYEV